MLDGWIDDNEIYKVDEWSFKITLGSPSENRFDFLHNFLRRSLKRAPTVIGRWPKTPRSFRARDMYIEFSASLFIMHS